MLIHLTLTTGHTRVSPRAEVADSTIASLLPMIRAGRGEWPGLWSMRVDRLEGGALYRAIDSGRVIVECAVAWDAERSTSVWRALLARCPGTDRTAPATVPWCAAAIVGTVDEERMGMLGDWERCVAWALVEAG